MNAWLHIDNARIWTGDPVRPWAKSITIVDGVVESLDQKHARTPPRGLACSGCIIDACGRTIAPGLIDSHVHLLRGGKSLTELDLSTVCSREEFQDAIARRHAELPQDQWLIATGWSQENWPGNELPTNEWLACAGGRPVVCHRMDMHAAVVNNAVLRLVGDELNREHVGVEGRVERDQITGKPTGLMIEAAAWTLINPLVPQPNAQARKEHLLSAQCHAHSLGITAVGSMEYARDVREVFVPMRESLTLRCHVTLLDRDWPVDCSFGRDFHNDDRLAVIGYKTFIDGTLGSGTARMLLAYTDDQNNRGMLLELAADGHVVEWAQAVAASGLSPSMHAIGDEAVRLALDALEEIDSQSRPRIEHAQQIDVTDMPRFRGRIASMQPLHKVNDCRYVRRRLGEVRLAGTFAFRKLLDAGAILAFGSDWPVVSVDPLMGIRAAVTGLTLDGEVFGAQENLTVEEALRAYTVDAAYALQMASAGVLRHGATGDLVMFDRDPFDADWTDYPPRVSMTIARGVVVYDGAR